MIINLKDLAKQTKNITVLYVEDEASVREQTKMILEMLFQSVDTASDGEEGWQKFQNGNYDIVITDISMPKLDGLELSRRIKEKDFSQKIAIISAHNTVQHLLKAIDIGVDGFLLKPLDINKMMTTLKNITDVVVANKLMDRYKQELEQEVQRQTRIIEQQLVTDKLTGLKNRFALSKTLEKTTGTVSLILMNIDNFNSINMVYGYDAGDKVLVALGEILKKNMARYSELYYLGNDEFAILCGNDGKDLMAYAEALQKSVMTTPIRIDDHTFHISVTIGIAKEDIDPLKHAYIALKEAQNCVKSSIKYYSRNLESERLHARIQKFSPILKEAVEKEKFVLHFQGIQDNKKDRVDKYECLVRIADGQNLHHPAEFIDIAGKIGLVPEITRIVIDRTFAAFRDNNYDFSINITEIDLKTNYLQKYFSQKLAEYGIAPSRVILEVLEGISATGAKDAIDQLMALKKMGFRIAIDDFGVQNSNFERVHAIQVDFIKIDGSFIKDINTNPKSYSAAKTIADFARSIGAKTVAEFVHSQEVQTIVEELGIEYSQGYHIGKPKPELPA